MTFSTSSAARLTVASSGAALPGERVIVMAFSCSRRDRLWLRCVDERRDRTDGEGGDGGETRAVARVALAALVDRLVPAADENLVTALAVAGAAGLLPHLVPAR